MDVAERAQKALAQLVASCREPVAAADINAGQVTFAEPALKALFEAASSLDSDGRARLQNGFAEAIAELPAFQASRLAVIVGALVERGIEAGAALDAILDGLARALPSAAHYFETAQGKGRPELQGAAAGDLDPALDPEAYASVMAARFFAMAAMSALVRSPAARSTARARSGLGLPLFELEQACALGEIYALSQLLGASDGETVVVLAPAARRGARFETRAVRNCAHLYTLLDLVIREQQVNLLGGWLPGWLGGYSGAARLGADEMQILEAARGSVEAYAAAGPDTPFAGKLAFGTWPDIDARGGFDCSLMVALDAALPAFPRLDGAIVLAAGDFDRHGPRRSWNIAFFDPLHGDLRCDVALERSLSRAEVDAWMTRIRQAQAK